MPYGRTVQQRRIVITGVNRGLGRELAERLVERGHRVWGTSRNGEAPHGVMSCAHLDLREEESIIDAARHLGQETGVTVLAVRRASGEWLHHVTGDVVLRDNDILVALGTPEQQDAARSWSLTH